MKLEELFEELQNESVSLAWSRKGNQLIRKFRCTSGKRVGRLVTDPSACNAPVDIEKRVQLRRTKAMKGELMTRKAQRTKRVNPTSKRVQALNKSLSR